MYKIDDHKNSCHFMNHENKFQPGLPHYMPFPCIFFNLEMIYTRSTPTKQGHTVKPISNTNYQFEIHHA